MRKPSSSPSRPGFSENTGDRGDIRMQAFRDNAQSENLISDAAILRNR
jgi:hypothetical protein